VGGGTNILKQTSLRSPIKTVIENSGEARGARVPE